MKPDLFNEFVKEKLSSRQRSIIQSKNLSVQAVPKFAELFRSSLMVSSNCFLWITIYVAHKGRSNFMLNRTRRLEKKIKEEQEEKEKAEREEAIDRLKREVSLLKNELDLAYDIQEKADNNAILLEKLFENNIIDEEGNLKNQTNME